MRRRLAAGMIAFYIALIAFSGAARAQIVGSTPTPHAPTQVLPRIAVSTPIPAQTRAAPLESDGIICGIPAGFVPYRLQMGDSLSALVDPQSAWTPPQIAALNCLDDADALPVGALIFLPAPPPMTRVPCATARLGAYTGDMARLPCLDAPRVRLVVWQPFERGILIWFADTETIYALLPDGEGAQYADTYVEGLSAPPITPPDGFYAPERGFRLVWDALGGAESPLRWALARETGYDALTQPAGRGSATLYIRLPDRLLAVTAYPELGGALFWAAVPNANS